MYRRISGIFLAIVVWATFVFPLGSSSAATAIRESDINMPYGSFIVEDNNYFYYTEGTSYYGGPVYKANKDNPGKKTVVTYTSVKNLMLQDDWLYFYKPGDSMSAIGAKVQMSQHGLYKMKTDGTRITMLSGKHVNSVTLIENTLYFVTDTGALFKVSINGSQEQQMLKGVRVSELFVSNGWIYYSTHDKGTATLNKIQIGATKGKKLANVAVNQMVVIKDWIYFQDDNGWGIYRIHSDGTGLAKLATGEQMIVSGDAIYFINRDKYISSSYGVTSYLTRMNLDGTAFTRLSAIDSVTRPNLLGDSIYYYGIGNDSDMKRMRTDGNDWRYLNRKPIRLTSKLHVAELQKKGISYTIDSSNEELLNYEKSLIAAKKRLPEIIRPEMTDAEKLKAVHDHIVLNTRYDHDNYVKDTVPEESYREYGVLFKGTAVCDGYARTLKMFLDLLGIENYYVAGKAFSFSSPEGQGHAWNVVKIDGKYYQVDTTWDDPVPNRPGEVSYDYFMVDDEFMTKSREWAKSQAPAAG